MKLDRYALSAALVCVALVGGCTSSEGGAASPALTKPAERAEQPSAAQSQEDVLAADQPATDAAAAAQDSTVQDAQSQATSPTTGKVKTTKWFAPALQSSESGGDGDGFERAALSSLGRDGLEAIDLNSGSSVAADCLNAGKDRHVYRGFGAALPSEFALVDGIEVRVRARSDSSLGRAYLCVQLSWNRGREWTWPQRTNQLTEAPTLLSAGHPHEPWGRTWTPEEISNQNLWVRIVQVADDVRRDFYMDSIDARLSYH